jgi:hypothetical protein
MGASYEMPTVNLGRRSREILDTLERELTHGAYAIGSALPSERDLAARFGVSRPTIRRAVAVLEGQGRICTRHGSGMTVCGPKLPETHSATISVMGMFDAERLRQCQAWLLRRGFLLCAFSVTERHFDPEVERLFLAQVRREGHHGLVAFCSPVPPGNAEVLDGLASAGTRIIHIAPFRLTRPDQEYLLPDFEAAGQLAGERLAAIGCPAAVFVRLGEAPYEMQLERGFRKRFPAAAIFRSPPNVLTHPPARRQMAAFLAGLRPNTGVFCRSRDLAAELAVLLRERASPLPLHLVAADEPDCGTSPRSNTPFDRLVLPSQQERTQRALETLLRPDTAPVRELLAPTWVPAGPGEPPDEQARAE